MENKRKGQNNLILKRLCIYRYSDNGTQPLGIFLCNTAYDNRIVIIPLTPDASTADSVPLSTVEQYANPLAYKEIFTDDLIQQIFIKSAPARITQSEFIQIHQKILNLLFQEFRSSVDTYMSTLDLFEKTYQFIKWQQRKYTISIPSYMDNLQVYENAIYWADIGINVGSELNKRRPVLIWKKRINHKRNADSSFIVIPITSKSKGGKYYMNVPVMIGTKQCYLRIEDMRRINIRRIISPITDKTQPQKNRLIFIDNITRNQIKNAIKQFYIFDNQYNNSNS